MSKNLLNHFSLHSPPPNIKICSYCKEHKLLHKTPWKFSRRRQKEYRCDSSSESDKNEHQEDLPGGNAEKWKDHKKALFRSSAIIRNFKLRKQYQDLPSPISCLKSLGISKKVNYFEKKVNFNDEKFHQNYNGNNCKESPIVSNASNCYDPTNYESLESGCSFDRDELRKLEAERRDHRSGEVIFSNAEEEEDHPRLKRHECKLESPIKSRAASDFKFSRFEATQPMEFKRGTIEKDPRRNSSHVEDPIQSCCSRGGARASQPRVDEINFSTPARARESSHHSTSDSIRKREARGVLCKKKHRHQELESRLPPGTCKNHCSGSSPRISTVDKDLVGALQHMSVNTSPRGFSGVSVEKAQKPRVAKPRDGLKRPGLKRMLVYPPEGELGQPLTLLKTWSNIDCQVKGDASNGFRYKVYYIQKFESDKWFPNEKTGNPFRRKEDADCSTDYG